MTDFWEKADCGARDECWEWQGPRTKGGYGTISVKGRTTTAHRVAWELGNDGRVPKGLDVDHLCRNRACVNPDHLEPVTHKENVRRGSAAQKMHCVNGHRLSGENLYRDPSGARHCRTCRKAQWHRHYRKKGWKTKQERDRRKREEALAA